MNDQIPDGEWVASVHDYAVDKALVESWVEALESGEYQQTTSGQLRYDDTYCCLGVAADIAIKTGKWNGWWDDDSLVTVGYTYADELTLPWELAKVLGLNSLDGHIGNMVTIPGLGYGSLAAANDAGVEFSTLAKFIREIILKEEVQP